MDIELFRNLIGEYDNVDIEELEQLSLVADEYLDTSNFVNNKLVKIYLVAHLLKIRDMKSRGQSLRLVNSASEGSVSINYSGSTQSGSLYDWLSLTPYGRDVQIFLERNLTFIGESRRA